MQDNELLRQYFDGGSQEAFAELVRRHVDFVFSTARRQVRDSGLAEDVSQTVFCLLARKAGSLLGFTTLTGWLYRTTCFSAARTLRGELRRRRREQRALEMNADTGNSTPNSNDTWAQLAPMLDEAIATLGDKDRLAVLLRFFQHRSMRTVGDTLGVSEAAAKMRIARSMERLRGHFAKRGVACSITGLSALLADRAVEAAPANLSAKLTSAVISGLSGASGWSIANLMALLARFKIATLLLGTSSGVALLVVGWQVVNHASIPRPSPVEAAGETEIRDQRSEDRARVRASAALVPKSFDDVDLAAAIAGLRAALHSTSNKVEPGFEAPEALRAFGTHLQVAFEVLKEEAGAHDKSRHSADDAELAPRRAVGTMGFLGKSVPEAVPWLWALYDKEPSTASDSIALTALSALYGIGFEPKDIARLAESVLAMTAPAPASNEADSAEAPGSQREADAFVKSQVAGWIAELFKRDPEATRPFLSAVRNLLSAQDASVRFWGACALLQSDGGQTPEVLAEVCAGLKNPDPQRLAWASQLLKEYGDAARPVASLLVEAANASDDSARDWAFLAAGKIASELRNQVPEVGAVLAKEEEDQRLLDKINAGTYTGNDLVEMLNDRGSAALGATLLGEMGRAATNALPALFEVASRQNQDDKEKILTAIRKIDPHAALSREDVESIVTSLMESSDGPHDKSGPMDRLVEEAHLLDMSWCTRVGFMRFATNVASTNPDGYKAFVGAVLAKEPEWRDLLVSSLGR